VKRLSDSKNMAVTKVIVCGRCGGLLLASDGQKTRTCPYCGAKVDVDKARTVASAETAYEASALLRRLKSEAYEKQKRVSRQSRL
jgi:uncharacterized CHY-type Zn-finger protein